MLGLRSSSLNERTEMSEFPEAKNWKMLIGGEWVDAADGDTTDVITPIDRNVVIAKVPNGKGAAAGRAGQAARSAFPEWAALPCKERPKQLLACADALDGASEEL